VTIGGYKLAWLADLVAAFVLENTAELFDETIYDDESFYDGIYTDDGLLVNLDGVILNAEVGKWLNSFREGSEYSHRLQRSSLHSQYVETDEE
jgi:hypothetical protein